ncbi:hypothetical protein BB560_001538 [Smittium megazygosporum]|uniref:Methionine aminopeptidase n=1 Tax=Smittium megazygosporum TaxID=133381 RepID=A0A2T9ZHA7_9FUNG|nr:hypothetical protein BB560_001538 [Smittium megazygosporum]
MLLNSRQSTLKHFSNHVQSSKLGRLSRPKPIVFEEAKIKIFGNYSPIYPNKKYLKKPIPQRPSFSLVPEHIERPKYANLGIPLRTPTSIPKLTETQISKLSSSCKLAADTLEFAKSLVVPGITTQEIDSKVLAFITEHNAYPSPLNYYGFPKSICTSINNIVAHGIPDSRPLLDGDIVNIDITVYRDGFHGDTSATFNVGQVDDQGLKLVNNTKFVLVKAIEMCGPGTHYKSLGNYIDSFATQNGYTVNNVFSGHGIGEHFHQNPLIYHFKNNESGIMTPGTAFTIEPMLNQGTEKVIFYPDEWTVTTADGGRSAQFEHTIVITDNGAKILTI